MGSKFCSDCGGNLSEIGSCATCGRVGLASPTPPKSGYFGFRGRISRKEYWLLYTLPLMAASIIAGGLDQVVFEGERMWISQVVSVLSLLPALAASFKRAHDRGRSAWFLLIMLIPVVGPIWLFIEFGFLRGTVGTNRFGTDPVIASTPMAAVAA